MTDLVKLSEQLRDKRFIGQESMREAAASALESLTAENAALKAENTVLKDVVLNPDPDAEPDNIRLHREKCDALDRAIAAESRAATLLQQRNEAFERAAKVAENRAWQHPNAPMLGPELNSMQIAAAIRNLSKES